MTIFYWGDLFGDLKEEAEMIKNVLKAYEIPCDEIIIKELPQCLGEYFDILFFDWGGMSTGNSMLEHFCRHILEHAENHPDRIYIMNSSFTAEAMKDAKNEMAGGHSANVFLDLEKAVPLLKAWGETK